MNRDGRKSQKLGKLGEKRAVLYFNQIGAKCIEKISTPMINVGGRAIYSKSSSVDFTAAFPAPGYIYIPVRVEVKLCDYDRLVHSRIKPHQKKWLTEWSGCGFYSFVLWVYKCEVFLIPYPNDLFKFGKSLSVKEARKIMKESWYCV